MTEGTDQRPDREEGRPETEGGPGGRLRAAREEIGLSRAQLAAVLMMDPEALAALEQDEYASLGAAIYVKGYIRRACEHLDLDPAPLIEEFERRSGDMTPPLMTGKRPREAVEASPRLVATLTVLVVVIALGLTLAWWLSRPGNDPGPLVPEAGSEVSEPDAGHPSRSTTREQVPRQVTDGEDDGEDDGPAADAAEPRSTPGTPPGDRAEETGPVPQGGSDADAAGEAAGQEPEEVAGPWMHLGMSFRDRSWVEVEDARDERLVYALFQSGDRIDVRGVPPFRIYLGNAPAVTLEMDGERRDLAAFTRNDSTARFRVDTDGRLAR